MSSKPLFYNNLNIVDIIKSGNIITYFQPIISIKKKSIIGLEALCRGISSEKIIPPDILFSLATEAGRSVELDRLCRWKALEIFSRIVSDYPNLILFLNFDTSIIDKGVVGSGNLFDAVQEFNLNPNQIAIEINESRVSDTESLKIFIDTYRNHGFIIALDDIGAGHSNLNRVAMVKPDILKIDMLLINNIDKECYKQEVLKSLVGLSKRIGALVVAEGLEREEEAIIVLDSGVDMLQGFYFSKPQPIEPILFSQFRGKKAYIAAKFKDYRLNKVNSEKLRRQADDLEVRNMVHELKTATRDNFDSKLKDLANTYSNVECIYILDESGIQISGTIFNYHKLSERKRPIFKPARKGTDHSLKDYYFLLTGTELEKYTTEPYISLASGNSCITKSAFFIDHKENRFILCVDLDAI